MQIIAPLVSTMETRLGRVEAGLRQAQLGNASLNDTGLPIYDADGNLRGVVGMQPDGTVAATSINNPEPPPVPSAPIVTAGFGPTLVVKATGESQSGTGFPADFISSPLYKVWYADALNPTVFTLGGTISSVDGDTVIGPLEYTQYVIALSAINPSGKESEKSAVSSGTPAQVVSADLIAGFLQEIHLNADIVGAAAIKANAVTATKIAPDSVETPHLVAGAVTSGKIAANSVNAGHIVAGSITTEKINALAVTANEIAANAIIAGKIQAGAVSATKLEANLILASRIIAGSATGARVEMHPTNGLQAFKSDGTTRTFWINAATGEAFFSGEIETAPSGSRIVINPGGTVPDEMRFYQGSLYGRMYADPAPNSTAAIIMEGSGSTRGRNGVYPSESFISFFDGSASRSACSSQTDVMNIWGGTVTLEGRDQWGAGEVHFNRRNTSGSLIGASGLRYRGAGSNEPAFYSPTYDTQIVWISSGMIVQNGAGGGTKTFADSSSRRTKKGERPIQFGPRSALGIIDAVESKAWNYQFEWVDGEAEPPRRKITVRGDDERDESGRLIKQGKVREEDAPPEKKVKPHFSPIAEDLLAVAPDLVIEDASIPGGYGLAARDMVGVLWQAVRELSAKVKELENASPRPS
jgi:choice-of-anchor A domain-containing protein